MLALPPNFVRRRACCTNCIATARTCARHLPSTSATTFRPRSPVAISDSTTFSGSSGGVDAYDSGLACVLYSFAAHLARTLASLVGCPLSVSAHPILMGAFPVSRRHTSHGIPVYILWRRMYCNFFTSSLGAQFQIKPPSFVVISILLIVMHEFLHFIFARDSFFGSCFFREQSGVSSLHLLLSSSVPASSAPAGPFSTVPPLLGQLDAPMFLFVPFLSIVLLTSTRACRCVPVHLLRNRTPTCLALVIVRALVDTHFIARNQPEHAQIRHCCSRPRMAMIFAAACASYSSNRNSMWSLSFLHPLF